MGPPAINRLLNQAPAAVDPQPPDDDRIPAVRSQANISTFPYIRDNDGPRKQMVLILIKATHHTSSWDGHDLEPETTAPMSRNTPSQPAAPDHKAIHDPPENSTSATKPPYHLPWPA